MKISIISVVYGKRWLLLKEAIDASLKDERVINFIVSDNGSTTPEIIEQYKEKYKERLTILENGKNLGYTPAIKKAIEHVRTVDCDYVFVLDDDCVPEEGYVDMFLENLKLFPNPEKIILAANRENVPGYSDIFYRPVPKNVKVRGTIFEILSYKNLKRFFENFVLTTKSKKYPFTPIIPTDAFVTGGSFIPMQAIKDAPLPDERLIMYGEDLKYAWGVRNLGYDSYLCYRPKISDIDMTFSTTEKNSHIFGLFDAKTPDYKVYLRLRNSIRISREFTYQSKFILFINIIFWFTGLLLLNLFKYGLNKSYIHRFKIVLQAVQDGYSTKGIPQNIKLPY